MTPSPRLKALLAEKDAATDRYATDARKVLREVRRQVVEELAAAGEESYAAWRLRGNLAAIERLLQGAESALKGNLAGGITELWRAGAALVGEAAGAGTAVGFAHVSPQLLAGLQQFGEHLVGRLAADAVAKVRGELTLGVLAGKTPHEVARAVAGTLTSPGVFESIEERAEIITKTELGRAYSTATQTALEAAAPAVPGMEKQWVHAGHPKYPRLSHLKLHGQHVPVEKPFVIGSLVMRYPRDPKAPASEVIRCGCDLVPWHPEWDAPA